MMSRTYKRIAAPSRYAAFTSTRENRMRAALAAFLLATSCSGFAQALRVETLGWMSGSWEQASERETVMESWTAPANGMMVGASLTTSPSRRSFEFLRIMQTADGVSYFASPGGRPPVEFKARELGDQRVVFENLDHPFPQRIMYWKEGEVLAARIEGNRNGELRYEEWKYKRVK